MAKKSKMGKKVKRSLKKVNNSSLMKSPAVQYFLLVVGICLVIFYLSKKDYNSLMMLLAAGVLTTYFTKNMTITLGVAILVSLIVRMKVSRKEGMKNTSERIKKESVAKEKALRESVVDNMQNGSKCWEQSGDGWKEVTGLQGSDTEKENKCNQLENCWAKDSTKCKAKDGFSKRMIPSSKPAKVQGSDDDDDEVDTDRIDYAKTLEQAYDNLQNMLGKDGIKGLTSETSRLVEQQSNLMESLKGMGPMLKEAKQMMVGMKDMGSLETMKDMKSIMKGLGK